MELAIDAKQWAKGLSAVKKWLPNGYFVQIGCDLRGCFLGVRVDANLVRVPVYGDAISLGVVELSFASAKKIRDNAPSRSEIRFCEPSRPTALGREVEFSTRIAGATCDWVHPAASRASLVEIPDPVDVIDIELLRAKVADGFGGEFKLREKWKAQLVAWQTCLIGETDGGRLVLSDGAVIVVLAPEQRKPKRAPGEHIVPATIEKRKLKSIGDLGPMALWSGAKSHAVLTE